ncbi:MAG: FAD-dependent monooxygenase [Stackebrandtia sp.]
MGRSAMVIGGGIGGLTAAYALQRIGWRVTVYEQAPGFAPVGAGVGIAPNAVKALDFLGLGAAVRERGQRQSGLEIRLCNGAVVQHIPAELIERRYGAPFYALLRAELHRRLVTGLDPDSLRTGHRAEMVVRGTGSAAVSFQTEAGIVPETADLVVAADGVGSRLRSDMLPDYPGPAYARYTVWRGIVPAERAESLEIPPVLSETWGRGARFGSAVINDGQIYWFAGETVPEHTELAHDLNRLAARFQDWHDPIPKLLAATPEGTLLRHDVYYLRDRLPGFVHGRVALLGDAAHAVTPDIGQGACLAIEDAVTLGAAHLADDSGSGKRPVLESTPGRPRLRRGA